uniref:Transcription factor AP-1 n=1 Tax=Echinostoma caproni TaxID=27848 RepID=A0A183B4Y9_9TREM
LDTPTLYNFISRQAAVQQQQQQQQQASVSTSTILCLPTHMSQSLTEALSKLGNGVGDQSITIDTSLGCDLNSVQSAIQNTLSITFPGTSKDLTNLQLCSGPHQFDLTNTSVSVTNPTNAPILFQPPALKLEQMAAELNTALTTDPNQSLTDPLFWPLPIQTSIANDHSASQQLDARNTVGQMNSPLDDRDATKPGWQHVGFSFLPISSFLHFLYFPTACSGMGNTLYLVYFDVPIFWAASVN